MLTDNKRASISLLWNPDSTPGPLISGINQTLAGSFEHLPLCLAVPRGLTCPR